MTHYSIGFQFVGHSGFFSGPWSIDQNESNMYNTDQNESHPSHFLGIFLASCAVNHMKTFFFREHCDFGIKIEKIDSNSK